jgi:hypothetical protein
MSDREYKESMSCGVTTRLGPRRAVSASAWRLIHRRRFISGRELTAELTALNSGCTNWKFNRCENKPVRPFLPSGKPIPSGIRILADLHADDNYDDGRIHTLQMNKNLVTLYNSSSLFLYSIRTESKSISMLTMYAPAPGRTPYALIK